MRDLRLGSVERELGAGGYEILYESAGLEFGLYELAAPEPDRQEPHEDGEIYLVLSGSGVLVVEGGELPVREGDAVFVPARAEHRFERYERLRLLVVFERQRS